MTDTFFPTQSIDRRWARWENMLDARTPWQNHQGIWFKREDYFAPLGYGGPNGSKLRQLIWIINKYRRGKTHILTGASVQSPQLSMTAIVGAHYGLKSRQVVYSKPSTVTRHDNPRIAKGFGASFEYASGPYNPIIQRKVARLTRPDSLVVEYGITMPHDKYKARDVKAFHAIGARQVLNVPAQVTKLIIPAGSCNTLCSIILGLSQDPGNVKMVTTMGIGPDKRNWVSQRLAIMGVDEYSLPFHWNRLDLQNYYSYSQKVHGQEFDGIQFHPTYEAKIWEWINTNSSIHPDGTTGFWIVGSAPSVDVVKPFFTSRVK